MSKKANEFLSYVDDGKQRYSDLRQIPNNQEVFLFPHSDTALVLEILEMVEEGGARGDLWEAAKCVIYIPLIVLSQIILALQDFCPLVALYHASLGYACACA